MHTEVIGDTRLPDSPRRALRKEPWMRLVAALYAVTRNHGELIRHNEVPWASATFSGARHTIALRFVGTTAIAAGEDLIAVLPEHEFALPDQLVADARVVAVAHNTLPAPMLELEAEFLLLDDA